MADVQSLARHVCHRRWFFKQARPDAITTFGSLPKEDSAFGVLSDPINCYFLLFNLKENLHTALEREGNARQKVLAAYGSGGKGPQKQDVPCIADERENSSNEPRRLHVPGQVTVTGPLCPEPSLRVQVKTALVRSPPLSVNPPKLSLRGVSKAQQFLV